MPPDTVKAVSGGFCRAEKERRGLPVAEYRLLQRRLDRALPVAALLLCAVLLLLPLREEPYAETPFEPQTTAAPQELDEFLKLGSTDINTADKEELMALPKIGEVLAERVLQYRAEHGAFRDWEEFRNIQGVGERLVETLRPVAYLG